MTRPRLRRAIARASLAAAIAIGLAWAGRGRAEAPREEGWEVRLPERVEVIAGATAPLTLALAVDRGLSISRDAAVIIDLAPDSGVFVKKRRLGRADAVDPEADAPRYTIGLRGDAPGDHAVRIHIQLWLCGAKTCRPVEVRRTVAVAVSAPAPTVDAGVSLDAPAARSRR